MTRSRDVASNGGLVLLNTTTLSGASVNITNLFNSTYNNYKVVLNASTTGGNSFNFRLGTGGTPDSTSGNYRWAGYYSYYGYSGSGTTYSAGTGTSFMAVTSTGNYSGATYDIYNPYQATYTNLTGLFHQDNGYAYFMGGSVLTTTQYTDLNIICAATMSGTIKIYGYK